MKHFFLTGLPSSRTAWLANFLSCGPAFCFHDATRLAGTGPAAMRNFLRRAEDRIPVRFLGDSDSALLLDIPGMVQEFPDAKWVFVRRDPAACKRSFERRFTPERPYPGAPAAGPELDRVFASAVRLACKAIEHDLPKGSLIVDFSDLDKVEGVWAVWEHCLPGVPFCYDRAVLLHSLQVNVMPEKY